MTTISGSRTMNNESKVSLYIHDIFGTPKERFEYYMLPSLQAYGTVSRFDYAVAFREDGSERVMAFIHFRDVDENSFALKKLREEFAKTGYSDCYVLPGKRYFRIRENKTPISETTMNLDQVADCAIKSAEQIEEHVKNFSEFVVETNQKLKKQSIELSEIKETVKDNYDDFQLNDAFMRNLMNKRHLAFEEHVKRFNNLDSVLSEFVLDTNSAITKQSSEILHIKEKYMDCNQTVDSIRNENDWLHSQIHIALSQFHLKLDMRDSVIDKQALQIAEQSTQIAAQNERFSDMEKMHDSMNRIIDKMLENSEKMSNRIKVLEDERKYGH